jgi:uncharacterized repeat protein (TIGR01451 family)
MTIALCGMTALLIGLRGADPVAAGSASDAAHAPLSGPLQAPGNPILYPSPITHTAPLTTVVSITYDEPIDPTTVTSVTFAVHGMQSGLVTATHDVINGSTIIVTPTRPFHEGELVYAIATTRTLNISGTGPLTATQWQFNAGVVATRCVAGFTEVYAGSLEGVWDSSVAWGDYDNDGDLDVLLTGYGSGRVSKVYRNTGSGFSEVYAGSLEGVYDSSVAWGDYDNDGDLDILLTGQDSSTPRAKVYQNTGSGFVDRGDMGTTHVYLSSVAWGDYDNDGDLDILLTGYGGGTRHAKVYQNTSSGFSEVYPGSLTGVSGGSVAWGDYDNDGDLDILLAGCTQYSGGCTNRIAKVYQNTGSGFSEVYPGSLTGVSGGSVAWGDYDNDGNLDILLTGEAVSGSVSKVYRNTGNGFTEVYAGSLEAVRRSSVAWGDYDNDGDLDILLTGDGNSGIIAKVYRNTDSGFSEVYSGELTGVENSSVAWGDYDNDGDLDILLTGRDGGGGPVAKIYHNDDCPNVSKSVMPAAAVLPGTQLTYTVNISSPGSVDMVALDVWDALPTGITYVADSLVGGAVYSAAEHAIHWQGDLAAVSSDGPGYTLTQVTYEWEENVLSGTEVIGWSPNSDDGLAGPVPLGFDFPYFALTQVYTQVYVSTNGFVGFRVC